MSASERLTLAQLAALAAETEDQTEVRASGDFEYELPAEGVTVGRLIEYIELGKQPQKAFEGKDKPPAEMVRLVFELLAPKNIHEYEDADGNKKTRTDKIAVMISKKFGEKSSFKVLFDKLRYGRENIKHIAQMLGNAYVLTVVHNEGKDKKSKYANVNKGTEWLIAPPFKTDAITGEKSMYKVPEATSPLKLFLFDHPTRETWDSIFIDGFNESKDKEGNMVRTSRNWVQERIMSAIDFKGSKIEVMLEGLTDKDFRTEEKVAEVEELPEEVDAAAQVEASDEDALAALGLV